MLWFPFLFIHFAVFLVFATDRLVYSILTPLSSWHHAEVYYASPISRQELSIFTPYISRRSSMLSKMVAISIAILRLFSSKFPMSTEHSPDLLLRTLSYKFYKLSVPFRYAPFPSPRSVPWLFSSFSRCPSRALPVPYIFTLSGPILPPTPAWLLSSLPLRALHFPLYYASMVHRLPLHTVYCVNLSFRQTPRL